MYLDNNATTRPSAGVVEAVRRALTDCWQNPSSVHRAGQTVRHQVELARKDAAILIGVPAREIVFTSGGTEAIDLAIRGVLGARASSAGPPVVVSTRVEHAAVRDLLEHLEKQGEATIRWAPIDREGIISLDALPALLDGAALVTMQWANNETGAIQPVEAVGELCRARRVLFHCDGTQWVGKQDTTVRAFDLLTFAPHKFHGPKGVGVLWARRGVGVAPRLHGTQELGRRGGTENVPGILGAGAACREAAAWLGDPAQRSRLRALRDRFEAAIVGATPSLGAVVNGPRDAAKRLWNTTNIGFARLEAEALLLMLSERGVCASAGAACSSGSLDPSPVLLAMGIPREVAHGSLRFSLSKETTEAELDDASGVVIDCARRLGASLSAGG